MENRGDKYIQREFQILMEECSSIKREYGHPKSIASCNQIDNKSRSRDGIATAGENLQKQYYMDMFRFICWVITIEELIPKDKLAYASEILGVPVDKARIKQFLKVQGNRVYENETPAILEELVRVDIASGNTFGDDVEGLSERLLKFMEVLAFGICTCGKRKYSALEKERIQKFTARQRVMVRSRFEAAEKLATNEKLADTDGNSAGGKSTEEKSSGPDIAPRKSAERKVTNRKSSGQKTGRPDLEAWIEEANQEPIRNQSQRLQDAAEEKVRGPRMRFTVISALEIVIGIGVIVFMLVLLIEAGQQIADYLAQGYSEAELAQLMAVENSAKLVSYGLIAGAVVFQILPGVLGLLARKAEVAGRGAGLGSTGRSGHAGAAPAGKPGHGLLITAEVLSAVGLVASVISVVFVPSVVLLTQVIQILFLGFARKYRKVK